MTANAARQLYLVPDPEPINPARPKPTRAYTAAPGSVTASPSWTWRQRGLAAGSTVSGAAGLFGCGMALGASELGARIAFWILAGFGVLVALVLFVCWLMTGGSDPVATVRGKIIG